MTSDSHVRVPPRGSPSVSRAAAILNVMSDRPGGWSLTQLAGGLGLAKSSTLTIMTSLEAAGFVTRNGTAYHLDLGVLRPAAGFLRGLDITETFKNAIANSRVLGDQIAHLGVLCGTSVTFLARHLGRPPLPVTGMVGDRFPASITAVGAALLAQCTDAQIRASYAGAESAFPRWTSRSTRRLEDLLAKVDVVRRRGYAVDDGETHPGVYAFGVVVRYTGNLTQDFAISVSLEREGLSRQRWEEVLAELVSVRDGLETISQLG